MKGKIVITDTCIIYNDMPRGWVRGKGQPKWHNSLYHRWIHMWVRCRNPESKEYNSYKDCEIDERYKYLSNYINDIMELENFDKLCNEPSKWSIDKDKVNPNNRCYYFEHLTIVTRSANSKEQINRNGTPRPKKKVKGINIKDGSSIIFNSLWESRDNGFNPSHILSCLKGIRKSHKGYKWEELDDRENS